MPVTIDFNRNLDQLDPFVKLWYYRNCTSFFKEYLIDGETPLHVAQIRDPTKASLQENSTKFNLHAYTSWIEPYIPKLFNIQMCLHFLKNFTWLNLLFQHTCQVSHVPYFVKKLAIHFSSCKFVFRIINSKNSISSKFPSVQCKPCFAWTFSVSILYKSLQSETQKSDSFHSKDHKNLWSSKHKKLYQ